MRLGEYDLGSFDQVQPERHKDEAGSQGIGPPADSQPNLKHCVLLGKLSWMLDMTSGGLNGKIRIQWNNNLTIRHLLSKYSRGARPSRSGTLMNYFAQFLHEKTSETWKFRLRRDRNFQGVCNFARARAFGLVAQGWRPSFHFVE